MLRTFIPFFLFIFIFGACQQSDKEQNGDGRLLPPAKGAPGEIVMVIDSVTYDGVVGDQIREVFYSPVPWLPREEARFTMRKIKPRQFNRVLKSAKNLLYVTVINSQTQGNQILKRNFTKSSIDRVEEDPSVFMFSKEDEFARGQKVLHLFGLNEEQLAANIAQNQERIRGYFNDVIDKRTYNELLGNKTEGGIEKTIRDNFDCRIKVPFGYDIAIQEENFIWVRLFGVKVDKNFHISYTDYYSEEQFTKEKIIAYRDSLAKEHIYGDPQDPETFMLSDTVNFPVFQKEMNFDGLYAMQTRGLWKTNDITMGGPFVSYAIVDEARRRFYYIEGFLYSPGTEQREFMRELKVILETFRPLPAEQNEVQ